MLAITLDLVLFLGIIHVSNCERRITGGEPVTVDKTYVVYLVKAPLSDQTYDSWLCGGALVSSEFVITSAACVNDVDYVYVIAGYAKYVPDSEIETDDCTREKKKKVIYSCYPQSYQLKYDELDYWSFIDIALAKVESPYDFTDKSYESICSYIPSTINIGFESKFQEPGLDAMVFGWGHKEFWRKEGDSENYNEDTLNYAPLLIHNKTDCKSHYAEYKNMSEVIENYMICTMGKGNINDRGNVIAKSPPSKNGCTTEQQKVLGFEGISCEAEGEISDEFDLGLMRRDLMSNKTYYESMNGTMNMSSDFNKTSRRYGICQNDHGGPLVTWVGAHEVLIGVASVFKVSDTSQCIGPFLYTSTQCTSAFLDCVLKSDLLPIKKQKKSTRNDDCDLPASERGFETIEKHISWKNHPAGPADSEIETSEKKHRHASKKNKDNEAVERSKANMKTGVDKKSEGNERYPVIQKYPVSEINKPKEKYTGNQKYVVAENYMANQGVVEKYTAKANNVANQKYPLRNNYYYPANQRYPEMKKFATVGTNQFAPKGNAGLIQRPQHRLPN